jgi:hypothetical protein
MLTRRQLIRATGPVVLSSAGLSKNPVWALTSETHDNTEEDKDELTDIRGGPTR